jgi:competence protein ComEA
MVSVPVPRRRLVAAVLAAATVAVLGFRHLAAPRASEALQVAPVRAAPRGVAARPAARRLVVDVEGAVRRPGLVRLGDGSRVADAVAAAGGLARRADRSTVNLAAPVADGQQVLVPRLGAGGAAGVGGAAAGASSGPVSLSRASAEELDTLPGVGPVTAQKIVAYREAHGGFRAVDELDAIPGIGPARLEELRGLVAP